MSDAVVSQPMNSGQTPASDNTSDNDDAADKTNRPWNPPTPQENLTPQTLGQISEVMIFDEQCSILAHKQCLNNLPFRKAQQVFAKNLNLNGKKLLNPYFREEGIDFFYLSKNDVYIVAVQASPSSDNSIIPMICLDFLQRVQEIVKDCIGAINEAYISANRMLVFEILDEMTNLGYCFVSSAQEVKPYLTLKPVRPKVAQHDELASRFFGINVGDSATLNTNTSEPRNKSPNSAYINIVEGLSAVLGPNGEVWSAGLWGKLTLISTLEQPAPIIIDLNPDLVIRASAKSNNQVIGVTCLSSPSFHQCVDTTQFANDRVLRVLPPPDQTRLMVYTLSDLSCISVPIILIPALCDIENSRDKNLVLRLINQGESHVTASFVKVKVQFPSQVVSVFTSKFGDKQSSQYNSDERIAEWEVKKMRGRTEETITFRLTTQNDSSDMQLQLADIGPITMTFNVMHFSSSGLIVRAARVEPTKASTGAVPPECFFGVSTKAISFSVRTDTSRKNLEHELNMPPPM